jgi:hypothetical protein
MLQRAKDSGPFLRGLDKRTITLVKAEAEQIARSYFEVARCSRVCRKALLQNWRVKLLES